MKKALEKEYQLLSENEKTFTFKHPKGNTFDVAKHLVNADSIRKMYKIKSDTPKVGPVKMADGGEVPSYEPVDYSSLQSQVNRSPAMTMSPDLMPEQIESAPVTSPAETVKPMYIQQQQAEQQPKADPFFSDLSKQVGALNQPSTQQPMFQPEARQEPLSPYEAAMNKQFGMMDKAAKTQMEAQQQLAREQADLAGKMQQDIAKGTQLRDEQLKQITDQNMQYENELKNGKIDPMRVWNNTSTGNQILAAIAIGLSGYAAGASGRPNEALGMVNKIIDRDIDAQKANMDKTQNLMRLNMQKYGNVMAASLATKNDLLTTYQTQLQAAAARAATPMAQAQYQQQQVAIQQMKTQMTFQLAQMKTVNQVMTGGIPNENVSYSYLNQAIPGFSELAVSVGPKTYIAHSKEEATKLREFKTDYVGLKREVGDVKSIVDKYPVASSTPLISADRDRLQAAMARAIPYLRAMSGVTRLTDKEIELFSNQLGNPDELFKMLRGSRGQILMDTLKSADSAFSAKMSSGLNGFMGESSNIGYNFRKAQ